VGLFDRHRLNLVDVEMSLGRTLRGDPCDGEISVLCSLGAGRLSEARLRLGSAEIGADFRGLVATHLAAAAAAPTFEVTLPPVRAEELRQRAAREGRSVEQLLGALLTSPYS
jgi:hypothetical protein